MKYFHNFDTGLHAGCSGWLGVLIIGAIVCSLPSSLPAEPPPQPLTAEEKHSNEYLLEQIKHLGDASYRTRQLARWRLEQNAAQSVDLIRQRLSQVEYGVKAQLVELLGALAAHGEVGVSLKAREILEANAEQVSSLGRLAHNALQTIADLKESQAVEVLLHHGAQIGTPSSLDFTLNARVGSSNELALRIDERFHGGDEIIEWIQFLNSIETVYLHGSQIDSRHYRAVSKLRGVKNVKLKHVSMTVDDLRLFKQFDDLEHLGLNYVDLDDRAIEVLAELPVSQSLRIYGTDISLSAAEMLAQRLDGIEIYCGRGGYLGVGMDATLASTVVSVLTPGSGAQLAGIQLGDELKSINDVTIKSFADMRGELGKYVGGEKIRIKLLRRSGAGGAPEEMEVEVTLGKDPN